MEHIAQQIGQRMRSFLGLVLVDSDQGVDSIEAVEKEVRVDLALESFKLGFDMLGLQILEPGLRLGPEPGSLYQRAYQYEEHA